MIEVRLPHSVLGALVLGPLLALALLRTYQGMPFPLECRFEEYAEDPELNRVVKAAHRRAAWKTARRGFDSRLLARKRL